METTDFSIGELVHLDSVKGPVPAKVLSVSHYQRTVRVIVTATRGSYRRGEQVIVSVRRVSKRRRSNPWEAYEHKPPSAKKRVKVPPKAIVLLGLDDVVFADQLGVSVQSPWIEGYNTGLRRVAERAEDRADPTQGFGHSSGERRALKSAAEKLRAAL